MSEGDKSGDEVKKLSRLEREQEKVRIAQTNIDKILGNCSTRGRLTKTGKTIE